MASSQYSVRVLERSLISPPPGSVTHPTSLPLTFFDITWLHVPPVELLFLYHFPHPLPHFLTSHLPNLKSSLSLTLQHFHPLSGKLRPSSPDSTTHFHLRYQEGDSVAFTVAETDLDFPELVRTHHPRNSAKLQTLVPRLPKPDDNDDGMPLLAIQVTLFPDRGIGICFAVHHVACDGVSTMHFIKSWASSCKSAGRVPLVGPSPSFDRSVIVDPCDLYSEYLDDILALGANNHERPLDDATETDSVTASFALGPDRIDALKSLVRRSEGLDCSTFAVCCAYAWACLVKAQGRRRDGSVYFGFVVDWRKQVLRPANPVAYFGNCLGFCIAEAKANKLTKEDGVIAASKAIASAIEGLKEGVSKNLVGAVKNFKLFCLIIP